MAEQRNIPADLVEIGTLARPHGIRGEIRVNYYADSLELLRGDVVYLQAGNKPPRKMEIDTVRMHQGTPLIRFVEAPDRTAAEFLRGQTLLIPESALPELDEDEVYLHDMLGLSVVLDATGQKLGVLDHVLFHGEQELWSILTPEGKEILLPAVPEFVEAIDLDAGRILVAPPAGLLELYAPGGESSGAPDAEHARAGRRRGAAAAGTDAPADRAAS